MSQLDLFAVTPGKGEAPNTLRRTWRDGRNYAHLLVSKVGEWWCYGLAIAAGTAYEGFEPMPHHNRYPCFDEAIDDAEGYMLERLRRMAGGQFDCAKDAARLLHVIATQPCEEEASNVTDAEVQERWESCVAAGLIPAVAA